MNGVIRLRNICGSKKFLLKFRSAHSAAKADAEIEILTRQDAKVTQSAGGITVASVENYSPISQVSVVVKAGSRNENPYNLGIAHCLRNCASLSTKNRSAFSVTRHLEVNGSKLNITSTREHIIYTLQCIRDEIDSGLEVLADVSTNPAFKPWEVSDSSYRIKLDLALLENNMEAGLMEALHKVAFRGGLSNSLYCPTFMIGKHNSEMLQQYVKDYFTASRTSVVGLGVCHDHLKGAVDKLFDLSNSSVPDVSSKFGGGEVRIESDIPFVHTAIVAEGSGLLNVKETLSLGVLKCILGGGASSKLGGTEFTRLGEAASKCTDNPFNVSCLNINYADTGLFGITISGIPDDMKQLVKAVVSQMRDVTKSITESDLQRAKHELKSRIILARENSKDSMLAMCVEAATFGQLRELKDIEKSIDELKSSDVAAVAAKVMKTKPAMASVGRLHSTPYLEELI